MKGHKKKVVFTFLNGKDIRARENDSDINRFSQKKGHAIQRNRKKQTNQLNFGELSVSMGLFFYFFVMPFT